MVNSKKLEERISSILKKFQFFKAEEGFLSIRLTTSVAKLIRFLRVGGKYKPEFGFSIAGFKTISYASLGADNFVSSLREIILLDHESNKLIRLNTSFNASSVCNVEFHIKELKNEFYSYGYGSCYTNHHYFSSFSIHNNKDPHHGKFFISLETKDFLAEYQVTEYPDVLIEKDIGVDFHKVFQRPTSGPGIFVTEANIWDKLKKKSPLNTILINVGAAEKINSLANSFLKNSILIAKEKKFLNNDFQYTPIWPPELLKRITKGLKEGKFIQLGKSIVNIKALSLDSKLTVPKIVDKGLLISSRFLRKGEKNMRSALVEISKDDLKEALRSYQKKFNRKEVLELLLIASVS